MKFFMGLLLAACAPSIHAQSPTTVPDSASTAIAGTEAGREAANHRGVATRGFVGLVSGVPAGFFALFHPPLAAGGLATMLAAAKVGSSSPDDASAAMARARGALFETAFRKEYERRLRARRRNAALTGGVIGILGGLTMVYLILTDPNY